MNTLHGKYGYCWQIIGISFDTFSNAVIGIPLKYFDWYCFEFIAETLSGLLHNHDVENTRRDAVSLKSP